MTVQQFLGKFKEEILNGSLKDYVPVEKKLDQSLTADTVIGDLFECGVGSVDQLHVAFTVEELFGLPTDPDLPNKTLGQLYLLAEGCEEVGA